jgi:aspartyl-tRNA(Asn)/glutamyl-tRNA(Gln) amidotransferase subunit B
MKKGSPEGALAEEFKPTAKELALLLIAIEKGTINAAMAKRIFPLMFEFGKSAAEIVKEQGLSQIQDTGEIERVCREVIEKNPDNVAKFRGGNEGVFKFFVGQVMRAARGQADPQAVNDTLRRLLTGA